MGCLPCGWPSPDLLSVQPCLAFIRSGSQVRERDLNDAIYLTCVVDGDAHVLASRHLSLLNIGSPYEGVRIVTWAALLVELQARGRLISDG